MIRRLPLAVLCALALLAPVLAGTASTATADSARHHYPVQWDFLVNAFQANAGRGPNDPPPGSDLPCHPSKAHPRPVVLVHGLAADQSDNWLALAPFLANHGYCVFSLTYGNNPSAPGYLTRIGGLASMTKSARVLGRFVQHVRRITGAKKIDLLGHSEGGTMPDWYLKFDHGNRYVKHFVDLSGVLHGTTLFVAGELYSLAQQFGYVGASSSFFDAYCASCMQFLPTSPWMKKLDAPHPVATKHEAATCGVDGVAVDGVKYTSIATRDDELVRPPTSDFIKAACANRKTRIGVHNILIQKQCAQDQSDHLSVAADPNVARDILNALDPAHARRAHCQVVLPSVG
jgi:pimeloyl-ACP methyl ester carboxylesterase